HTSELQSLTNLVCRLLLGKKKCARSEEHTSELQSLTNLVCRLLLVKSLHRHHVFLALVNANGADDPEPQRSANPDQHCLPGLHSEFFMLHYYFLMIRRQPRSTPFPYTTLFRS